MRNSKCKDSKKRNRSCNVPHQKANPLDLFSNLINLMLRLRSISGFFKFSNGIKTALYENHKAHKGRMIEFAGRFPT